MTTKTEQEINDEKLHKTRPDLLPAGPLQVLYPKDRADVGCLWAYRDTGDCRYLRQLAFEIIAQLGGPPTALLLAGRVMGYGFRKHGDCTWRVAGTEQAEVRTHIASAERHLLEHWQDPDAVEEGSGLPVLHHALSQVLIALDLLLDPPK